MLELELVKYIRLQLIVFLKLTKRLERQYFFSFKFLFDKLHYNIRLISLN